MIYKQSKGPRGRSLYFAKQDGGSFKMVSKSSIPEDILASMEPEKPLDDTKPEFQKCIFCGSLSTDPRYLNGKQVNLCLEDYQTRTAGECVEKMRSMDSSLVPSNT